MDTRTFLKFREIVYERSGICLREGKEALVCARVGKHMRKLGISDYRDYLRHVQSDESGGELVLLLDAISTNVTRFFREPDHFDFLAGKLSSWLEAGQRRLRMWSAACSSGEEPYSMSMVLAEAISGYAEVDARILATDISTRMLHRCVEGSYEPKKVESVPRLLRARYFDRPRRNGPAVYRVREVLRKPILFRRLNLSAQPFPMQGPMDAIFCRNVMIYFDNDVRRRLLAEMYRLLKPGGYLMVGHAESLTGMMSEFKTVQPSIYVKQ
jgi:chemotaxis protein methyltransferase CheR